MKTAVITGGTGGIGEACVKLFSKKGYRVFFIYRSREEKAKQLEKETGAVGVKADISDYDSTIEAIDNITKQCFEIDVLINNAGISVVGLFQNMGENEWHRICNTNIDSVFNCCHFAVKDMMKRHCGKIINISSVWGLYGASCEVAYSATKGAVNSFTKALAKELAPSGIQVNAVACGAIDTEMNGHLSDDDKAELAEEIPAGRFGSPQEVAKLVKSLSGMNSYLTGQIITLDGGWI